MRRLVLIVVPLAALLLPLGATASEPAASSPAAARPAPPQPPPNMESYQLVLLKRGPAWTPDPTPEVVELQKGHIAHLTKMGEAGHIVIAGPFSDQADPAMRGMCLYRVGSLDEARRLASEDPAVKAGRLTVEVLTWWVEKGYMEFPKAPPRAAAPAP